MATHNPSSLTETLTPNARVKALLTKIEFARHGRYGQTCPCCNGAKDENWGYVEQGPDRGHENGCELRAILDLL